MSVELITLLMFSSMMLLILTGLPVAFALGGTAMVFVALIWGVEAVKMAVYSAYSVQMMYVLICIPCFIFTGLILQSAGIAEEMFETMRKWSGGLRGGLAVGVVIICAIFAAMVGISGAATVAMGLIALPAMLKRDYDKELALGTIQAGGALGILIPPSIAFAIYGVVARESIGQLFAGGLLPGLLLAGLFIAYIVIRCRFQPHLGPALPLEERASWKEKFVSLRGLVFPMALVFMIMGLILLGVTSVTEASGTGAIGAIVVAAIHRKFNWAMLKEALIGTLRLSGMIGWILIAAISFGKIYTGLGAIEVLDNMLRAVGLGAWGTLILMQLSFFVMGCFLDDTAILFICAPLYIPIIAGFGFDLVWFGVLFVMNTEMCFLTPPYGINLFYMKGIVPKGITIIDIYKSVIPYVGLQALGLALVMVFPQIALWLPGVLYERLATG
ncbi:C4-dicarboxylate TRAP transporter large permease protein DctM [subsurface metagenome]